VSVSISAPEAAPVSGPNDFSVFSLSSTGVAPVKWPLTLLAGVGNEFIVPTVGCWDAWVDIGTEDGGEERFAGCDVAWLGDVCEVVKLEA
jgi:hypothetical protein